MEGLTRDLLSGVIKNIVVLSGTGTSTNQGIQDYRSGGWFALAEQRFQQLDDPADAFSEHMLVQDPFVLYSMVPDMLREIKKAQPGPTHFFWRLLAEKHLLRRLYTQNIDGLDAKTGLDPSLIVETHGSLQRNPRGQECKCQCQMKDFLKASKERQVLYCPRHEKSLFRPSIVLYGESPPPSYAKALHADFVQCSEADPIDLLIVAGTSLKTKPVSNLIHYVPRSTRRLLINQEMVGTESPDDINIDAVPIVRDTPFVFEEGSRDIFVKGDCDSVVQKWCHDLNWELPKPK